jgi:hypothetical protein
MRRALRQPRRSQTIKEDLIRRYAPGHSFLDVGCMWTVHGGYVFLAEDSGATSVTGADLVAETDEFRAEHARRASKMRFVRGDLHDSSTIEAVGKHDVVFCAGVLYHTPSPLWTLSCLREMTGDLLIVGTATIPEVPGLEAACVFYPGLGDAGRRVYQSAPRRATRVGLTTPWDPDLYYDNWWWGMSPSALRGMVVTTGFEVVEMVSIPFFSAVVCRRVAVKAQTDPNTGHDSDATGPAKA